MFTKHDYKKLLNTQNTNDPKISIYIGTDRSGESEKFQLKFKNALKNAVSQLTDPHLQGEHVMNKQQAQDYLSAGFNLLADNEFWNYLSDGLAVFIGKNTFKYFTVPLSFKDFIYVNKAFYLRHLISLLNEESRFFVLALSQNDVRFFDATRFSISPVRISDLVPMGKEELIGVDNREKVLQHHSGGSDTIYHGHGGAKDIQDIQVKKYFEDVDKGLMKMLFDENAPLIIYSTEEQVALYKSISDYSNIIEEKITGNPENDDPVLIHEKAWNQIKSYFTQRKEEIRNAFEAALAEEEASFSIHNVVPAALNGKVKTIFVDKNTEAVWGTYDQATNKISIHPNKQANSICLLNKAAMATYNNGGKVLNIPRMEFPRIVAQVNAIYRY